MATCEEIVDLLREASAAYYNGGTLKMDDDTYDGLIERLKQLDPQNEYIQEIGAPVQGAVKLPYAMPSLDKIKPGEDTLKRFLNHSGGFIISEKLDGLSALWLPSTNQLLLRGDGIMGQDVSHLVALGIQGLSKRCPASTAIRGELIIPRSNGISLARSWVNGQIHQKNPNPSEIAKIRFVAYGVMDPQHTFKRSMQIQMMQSYGLELPWFSMPTSLNEPYLSEALQDRRVNSIYDTDGIVVAFNTIPKYESIATKAKNPKDCVAFKMPLADQSAETVVREVIWSPSAQGYLIPRLRFDPVNINSAKIEFCTGHNARMIHTYGVGPGAKIVIRRSGDVIPKLDKVITSTTPSFPPDGTWVWCGDEQTAVHAKSVGVTAAIVTAKLHHFLKTLEIPGVGPATALALVEAGITGPAALWATAPTKLSDILGPKTGASLYTNLRTVLNTVDEITLMQASSAMPRGIGDSKLKNLFAMEIDPRKWGALSTPTGWTTDSLTGFLTEFSAYTSWRLKEVSWIPYPILSVPKAAVPITGETICITGFRDKDIEVNASVKGHTFVPNLTGKVTLLLVPDGPVKESEKVLKARARNIRILSRSDFIAQYLS
jgi:NAD-dependent DNA ligase